jgi:hypothetical protein
MDSTPLNTFDGLPHESAKNRFILRYFQIKSFTEQDPGIIQLFGDGMHLVHHNAQKKIKRH